MPVQPIADLDKVGLVIDTPSIQLPLNGFSGGRNIRFDDGTVSKMKGHLEVFKDSNVTFTDIQYIAHWSNPQGPLYLLIDRRDNKDYVYTVTKNGDGTTAATIRSGGLGTSGAVWQHTVFNGGYSIVINNGISTPKHLTGSGTGMISPLPGWDSYAVTDKAAEGSLTVTAGIVTALGNLLMAGDLRETLTSSGAIVRNLNGVVRSSQVAAPGSIPQNWDPFATGAGTADELILADTGTITAMAALQGNMYVYTRDSIHQVQVTNGGLRTIPVTTQYGALTHRGVMEFDGKHVVVGSNDIYIFGGHPGDIQSISDGRVRDYFYTTLSPLHPKSIFMLRNQSYDEIWLCYPTTYAGGRGANEALVWNYRGNVWTIRDLPMVPSGDIGPIEGGGLPNTLVTLTGTRTGSGSEKKRDLAQDEIVFNYGVGAPHVATIRITPPVFIDGTRSASPSTFTYDVPQDPVDIGDSLRAFLIETYTDYNFFLHDPKRIRAQAKLSGEVSSGWQFVGSVVSTTQLSDGSNTTYWYPTIIRCGFSDGTARHFIFGGGDAGREVPTSFIPSRDVNPVSGDGRSHTTYNIDEVGASMVVALSMVSQGKYTPTYSPTSHAINIIPTTFDDSEFSVISMSIFHPRGEVGGQGGTVLSDLNVSLVTQMGIGAERPWPIGRYNDGRNFLVMTGSDKIYAMDLGYSFNGDSITSYVERRNLHVPPTKDTETVTGIYMDTSGTPDTSLAIDIKPTDRPSISPPLGDGAYTFKVSGEDADYKTDIRENGRLINIRISHTGIENWSIEGIGLDVIKGGTR